MKTDTKARIMEYIFDNPGAKTAEISEGTGVSRPTVLRALKEISASGFDPLSENAFMLMSAGDGGELHICTVSGNSVERVKMERTYALSVEDNILRWAYIADMYLSALKQKGIKIIGSGIIGINNSAYIRSAVRPRPFSAFESADDLIASYLGERYGGECVLYMYFGKNAATPDRFALCASGKCIGGKVREGRSSEEILKDILRVMRPQRLFADTVCREFASDSFKSLDRMCAREGIALSLRARGAEIRLDEEQMRRRLALSLI